jgi:uncharacterized tellurite resistance protein B-like protein
MTGFDEGSYYSKQQLIALLLQLARVDGSINPVEDKFIHDIGTKLGMTETDILIIDKEQSDTFRIPETPGERMNILYHLLFLMKADEKIRKAETDLIYNIALRLGIRDALTTEFIELMQKSISKKVPVSDMTIYIKKYLN